MATKKFSEFDSVPTPVLADIELVGLDDAGQNARFPGSAFDGAAWGNITGTLADQTDLNSALNGKEDSLGNPGTNGYVLSSTTGGVRSWIPNGSGSVAWGAITGTLSAQTDLQTALNAKLNASAVSAFGLTLIDDANAAAALATLTLDADLATFALPASTTITTYGKSLVGTADADAARTVLGVLKGSVFDYKPAGEPIVILAIGDSNMLGIGGTDGTLTLNSNVYVRSTPGTSAWDAADLAWFNDSTVDPAGPLFPNLPTAPTSFTGVLRSNNGDTGYAAAVRLQEMTGRDVYLFQTACAGKTMAYWLPGGGAGKEGMNALDAQLPDAFAEMPNAPTFFDVVIMSDSTNDAGTGVTPQDFLDNFTSMYNYLLSEGWISQQYTRWFQLEAAQVYPAYAAGWLGLQYLSNAYGERVQILSSVDLPVNVDNTHFEPFALQMFGVNAADCTLSGLTPKSLVRPGSYVETVAGLTTNLACNGFDLTGVNVIHGAATADTPITVRVGGDSAYDMVYTPSDVLMVTSLRTGGPNGAWLLSRMNANAGFPAFRLLADNALSGSSSLLAIGDAADLDFVTVSRTGLINAKGGFSTTAASSLGVTTVTRETIAAGTLSPVAVPSPALSLTGTFNHNWTNNQPGYRIDSNETHSFAQATSFTAGATYAARDTFKNAAAFTGAFGVAYSFLGANTFTADTTASSALLLSDITSIPTFNVVNGGTLTCTALYQYVSDVTVDTGATVSSRLGFVSRNKTGSGAVTSQAGLASALTTAGATNTTGVLIGTSTIPSGNFGVYQSDTLPNRWGGGQQYAYRSTNATSITATVADYFIKVTTTSGLATVNLPDATTCAGLQLIVKRTGTQTVRLDPFSSQTIDSVSTLDITVTDQLASIFSDGANWLLLHSGAP